MVHQVSFFSLAFLFFFLNQTASEAYHICFTANSTLTDLCTTPCLTLSEFAANLSHHYIFYSNTTLLFLPGTHYLTVNVSISNLKNFSMTSESMTAQVVCRNYSHVHFNHSQYISISNLEFIGCGGNHVEHVEKFLVKNTMFNGQNISSTALEIIETATQIVNSTFKFNRKGKLIKINESHTIEEIANNSIRFNGS